jgi:hypothetical protein
VAPAAVAASPVSQLRDRKAAIISAQSAPPRRLASTTIAIGARIIVSQKSPKKTVSPPERQALKAQKARALRTG